MDEARVTGIHACIGDGIQSITSLAIGFTCTWTSSRSSASFQKYMARFKIRRERRALTYRGLCFLYFPRPRPNIAPRSRLHTQGQCMPVIPPQPVVPVSCFSGKSVAPRSTQRESPRLVRIKRRKRQFFLKHQEKNDILIWDSPMSAITILPKLCGRRTPCLLHKSELGAWVSPLQQKYVHHIPATPRRSTVLVR